MKSILSVVAVLMVVAVAVVLIGTGTADAGFGCGYGYSGYVAPCYNTHFVQPFHNCVPTYCAPTYFNPYFRCW